MKALLIPAIAIVAIAGADDTGRLAGAVLRMGARAVDGELRAPSPRTENGNFAPTPHSTVRCRPYDVRPAAFHPPHDSLLQALREGGLVIVFRHSTTDHSQGDARELSRTDRATQRNLTASGVEQARQIGASIRALSVPVEEIYSSPLFRTMDTAVEAFGRAEPSEALWRNGTRDDRVRLLAEPPRAGTNRILVTHNFVLMSVFDGMRPGDLREGDAVVVRPRGEGKYEIIGRLTPEELRRLATPDAPRPSLEGHAAA